jgi:pimeloyl-ACP methyl ester carboxylesterase
MSNICDSSDRFARCVAAAVPPECVVLVHCSASSAKQWKPLTEEMTGFLSIAIDLRGHGSENHWHGARPLSLSEEAAAILDSCPDAPFHLVGHSYGGAVALRFASSYPERLRSLTLIEPSCFHLLKEANGGAKLLGEIRAVAEAVNRGVICGDYRGGMQTFIDYWSKAGTWADLPDSKKTQFAKLALHVAHHFWSLIEEPTSLAAYAGVNLPTLILCGTHSPGPSRTIVRLLAEALPCAQHCAVPDAGHMSPITHPAEVNRFILEHLSKNGAQTNTRGQEENSAAPIGGRSHAPA